MDIDSSTTKWNNIYTQKEFSTPADILKKNSFLLPEHGTALDLACGLGENALFLAGKGLQTQAWDLSTVALAKLDTKAKQQKLNILIKKVVINSEILTKNTFDVIVISRFLDRSLTNAIIDSLNSNGLLFYQTYIKDKPGTCGPKNTDFLLSENELLTLFQSLKTVVYKEFGMIGDLEHGERNEAFFIGQKA